MSGKRIRVLIADDHTIVRSGVRLLLEGQPDMEVIGEALTGEAAADMATKAAEPNELPSAIRSVARGEAFLSPAMAKRLMQDYLSRAPAYDDPESSLLTPREREVLRLIADGYTNKEIADRLVLSPSTVHSHRNNLMRKLDLNTQHGLIQYARDRGWVRGGPGDTPTP